MCTKGWKDINGKCFLLSKDLNDVPYQLTYEEAVEFCFYQGGRLYEPRNQDEQESVLDVSKKLSCSTHKLVNLYMQAPALTH